jgi:hypothetical protein
VNNRLRHRNNPIIARAAIVLTSIVVILRVAVAAAALARLGTRFQGHNGVLWPVFLSCQSGSYVEHFTREGSGSGHADA